MRRDALTAFAMQMAVKKTVETAGSLRAAAKHLGVSAAYLSDVLHGNREVGKKLAAAYGYHKIVSRSLRYEPIEMEAKKWTNT